jgi:hypothetical protein
MHELHVLHFIAICVALVSLAAAIIVHDVRSLTKRHTKNDKDT